MEVAYWQVVVILSVAGAFLFGGRKAALIACVFWTLWTFAMVFATALAVIQLASAWGTFLVCRSISDSWREAGYQREVARRKKEYANEQKVEAERQRREADRHRTEVDRLKRQLDKVLMESGAKNKTASVVRNIAEADPDSVQFISGSEHYELLKRALSEANDTLSILSGWIGSPVLDTAIRNLLEDCIGRGVNVYIGFGWSSSDGHSMTATAMQAYRVLVTISQKKTAGRLLVGKFPNHEKVLVVDDAYIAIGSNNWLSNSHFTNSERSVVLKNPEFAHQEQMRIMALVSKSTTD